MRGDFEGVARRARFSRLEVLLFCQALGVSLFCLAIWAAVHFGNAPAVAGEKEPVVTLGEAREMTRGYSQAVAGASMVIARGQEWPERTFPGLSLWVSRGGSEPGRVTYDIVALAGGEDICRGAIEGGRGGIANLQVGDMVLPPPAVQPYRSGKATVHPADEICTGQRYPLTLKFTHIQVLNDGAAELVGAPGRR